MRAICVALMVAITSIGVFAYSAEEPSPKEEQAVTVQDLDRQIRFLKDNIEKFNGMALSFDRKAGTLQSHDYTGARNAAGLRDECRGIAKDLETHLAKLEGQRAEMLEQQKEKK